MGSSRFSVVQMGGIALVCLAAGYALGRFLPQKRQAHVSVSGEATAPVVLELQRTGHGRRAETLAALCREGSPCDCSQAALAAALDHNLHELVLKGSHTLFDQCPEGELGGLRAEALARSRSSGEAKRVAQQRSKDAPRDPFALYAMAHAYYVEGNNTEASLFLAEAISAGRGETAHLLAGLIAYQAQDYPAADRHFRSMLQLNPESVDALYNLGVTAATQSRYRSAREKFLAALRVDQDHQDARYNLAIITHAMGAQEEALHHLAEYKALVEPADPRLETLRVKVSQPVAPALSSSETTTDTGSAGAVGSSGATVEPR